MKVETITWQGTWSGDSSLVDSQFVVCFFSPKALKEADVFPELKKRYPHATVVGCSTGGEIVEDEVLNDSAVASAVQFDSSSVQVVSADVEEGSDSKDIGETLAKKLPQDGLKAVFILSDGLNVNGTPLVRGLLDNLPEGTLLTGGLAGDGADFGTTYVGVDGEPQPKQVIAVGFYGDDFVAGSGSMGGWQPFGPQRKITKSDGNVLLELDGQPALALYKTYLGDEAENLPGSALLYPLTIYPENDKDGALVRTIVAVDEDAQSMTFAGDVPEGYTGQLMSGNFDNLTDGASAAAEQAKVSGANGDMLAILVSCIGRKLLMGQMISDETEAVDDGLPDGTQSIGFYSYGEIAPHGFTGKCQLHNQTMTITVFGEK
ncbi:MAG: FIST C-terminal domain-containing protein [Alphaproteobacteria bacterium]|nr:FIST C-terminal domain-containing protein [Alphaproteobacteria bacterium]MDD9920611.1 FIST C-terminal domain-containing protein [Alphaproteobacteria bacterium]